MNELTSNELNTMIEIVESVKEEIKSFDEVVKRIIPTWKPISTLMCPNLDNFKRRSGNTTKQCNFAIEMIMSGHLVGIKDHFKNGENKNSNQFLFNKIIKRLEKEHNLSYLLEKNFIGIDYINLNIYFKNEF